jgi:tetratricopeptide (TPR) repeat protein
VFAEQLWPNLVLFAAGQAAAWYYLHTGRTRIGTAATVALWLLADWFLVAKYVFRATGPDLLLPLISLQLVAAATFVALLFAQWRRRRSRTARQRAQLFAAGIAAYLRGAHAEAEATFGRLVRNDPWDTAAWTALGNVMVRTAQPKRARRCYRRALGVDTRKQYAELVRHQLDLLQQDGAVGASPSTPSPARAPVETASTA